ncbi:guanine nucleotide-binding protein subunit beta [Monosporozyma servazzii]
MTTYEMQNLEPQLYVNQQAALFPDILSMEDDIQQRILSARQETKNLYTQIDKIKKKIQDVDLFEMTRKISPLDKNAINLKPTIDLKGHNNKISDFRWSQNSKNILSASQDGFMLIWDVATGLKQNAIPLDSQWVLSCAISPSGGLVASAGLNNNCTVYKVSRENRVQQNIISIFKGHTGYVSSIDFLDESQILTASGDMTCALWDIPKAKRVREYADHLGDVLSLSLPPNTNNSNIFASCGSDGYLYIWDTRTQSNVQSFFVSDSDVSTVKFFHDENAVLTGSDDGTINMFDLRSDCSLAHYSLSAGLESQKRVNTTSQRLYTASTMEYGNSTPKSPTVSAISSSYLDNQGVVSIDFSKSGRLMYACYTDLGCIVWDTLNAEVVGKLECHTNRVSGVRSSPDGLAVCTGSWDATMKVWTPSYS